jgi:hypothetical protein
MPTRLPFVALLALLLIAPACDGDDDDDDTTGSPDDDDAAVGDVSAIELESLDDAIGGPLAGAVVGDVLMANDRIHVVLQKPGRALALNPYGGNIIDADVIRDDGVDRDRFGEAGLFINSTITCAPETMEIVSDGSDGAAAVRFVGPSARADYINAAVGMEQLMGFDYPIDSLDIPPLTLTLTYTLEPGWDHVRVDVEVVNDGEDDVPMAAGWLIHAGLAENYYPELGGYAYTQIAAAGAVIAAEQEVAYGFAPLPYEPGAHGLGYMAGGSALMDQVQVLDVLDWPDSATVVLAPGDTFAFDAALAVARDVSGVLSTLRSLAEVPSNLAVLSGRVRVDGTDDPVSAAQVAALDRDGDVVLASTVADGDGRYELQVPAGAVDLVCGKIGWPHADDAGEPERIAVSLTEGDDVEQDLFLPPTGQLTVEVTDTDGDPLPARVMVLGLDPSPPYEPFEPVGLDPLPPGVTAMLDTPVTGQMTVDLEPGEYDLAVSRGVEYDAAIQTVEIVAGQTATAAFTLNRVLDTTGMLSGDFHIHAAAGPDLVLTNSQRVANYAADGVEVLVISNHAYVADLTPEVEELALEPWVSVIPSQEVTTFDYGHFGLFPMVRDDTSPNGGAFDWVGVSPTEIFDWGAAQDREMVVQINHPRAIPTPADMQNYFTVLDLLYDGAGPYIGPDHFDPMGSGLPPDAVMFGAGFTAMEVMTWLNVQGLSDWFNLLSAGYRFTAVSNSDSHTTRVEGSGWPRNFVVCGADDPADLDVDGFVSAINRGQLAGSFGPLLTLEAACDGGGDPVAMGGMIDCNGEAVEIRARVQAAPWVPVDTLDLYADGEIVTTEALALEEVPGAEGGIRHEQTVTFVVDAPDDTWIVAVAHGSGALYPYLPFNQTPRDEITLERIRAGDVEGPATAFAFANPIFVDADGDGVIAPSHHVALDDWEDYRRENRLDPY